MRLLLGTCLLLSACGDEVVHDTASGDACLAGPTPTLTVGKGELGYEAVDGDASAELIHGPQGGYHIYIALQATDMDPSTDWLVSMTGTVDGELLAEGSRYVTMRCNPSVSALQAWGLYLIFDAQPEELHGRSAVVEVTATDAAGTKASDDATFSIFDPSLE